jgi:hypothetical protein
MGTTDLKLYGLNAVALSLSMTNLEPALKIILLILSIGYTAIRIYSHFEDKNKDKNEN